jgi:CheY-like chemotaxis protein
MLALFVGTDLECARAIAKRLAPRRIRVEISTGATIGSVREIAPVLIVAEMESGGSTLCNRLKQDPGLRRIPFLLTTGPALVRELTAHAELACRADDHHARSGAQELDILAGDRDAPRLTPVRTCCASRSSCGARGGERRRVRVTTTIRPGGKIDVS